jgi:hypothetical protein
MEYNGFSKVAALVHAVLKRIPGAIKWTTKAYLAPAEHFKEQHVLSIGRMIGDCLVAFGERHISFLALTEIAEGAVSGPFVGVAMSRSAPREEENDRVV